mmetsp:Transcript_20442/g.28706  ORF Transcript_20442/g.28706 Transcript_20442/m.28706 type:complete len:195 (+) Transcript_20442:41-625(+)
MAAMLRPLRIAGSKRRDRKGALRVVVSGLALAAVLMCVGSTWTPASLAPRNTMLGKAAAVQEPPAASQDDPVARFIKRIAKNGTLAKATSRSCFGVLTGVCAGYATKKIGQTAAVVGGGTLLLLQGLSHVGIVKVNWQKVQTMFGKYTDLNKDGVTDASDLLHGWAKAKDVLTTEMVPSAAGFSAGFACGLFAS